MEFWLVVVAALGLGGFVKGATGMGLPLVSVPALAAFLGVPHTLAILTVPLIVTNGWQVWRYFSHRHGTAFLTWLLPAGAVGIGIGTWALTALPVRTLSLVLAALVVSYIALHLAVTCACGACHVGRFYLSRAPNQPTAGHAHSTT